jgi:hypothetical protein
MKSLLRVHPVGVDELALQLPQAEEHRGSCREGDHAGNWLNRQQRESSAAQKGHQAQKGRHTQSSQHLLYSPHLLQSLHMQMTHSASLHAEMLSDKKDNCHAQAASAKQLLTSRMLKSMGNGRQYIYSLLRDGRKARYQAPQHVSQASIHSQTVEKICMEEEKTHLTCSSICTLLQDAQCCVCWWCLSSSSRRRSLPRLSRKGSTAGVSGYIGPPPAVCVSHRRHAMTPLNIKARAASEIKVLSPISPVHTSWICEAYACALSGSLAQVICWSCGSNDILEGAWSCWSNAIVEEA